MRFQGGPRSPTRRKGRTEATALAQRRGGPLLQERIPGRWGQGSNAPVQGFSMQQCLYFLPLPQGHGSFLPGLGAACLNGAGPSRRARV